MQYSSSLWLVSRFPVFEDQSSWKFCIKINAFVRTTSVFIDDVFQILRMLKMDLKSFERCLNYIKWREFFPTKIEFLVYAVYGCYFLWNFSFILFYFYSVQSEFEIRCIVYFCLAEMLHFQHKTLSMFEFPEFVDSIIINNKFKKLPKIIQV